MTRTSDFGMTRADLIKAWRAETDRADKNGRRADRLETENAPLRAELEENTGVISALRRQRDCAEQRLRLADDVHQENVRMRAALDRVQALCLQLPPNMPDPIETAVAHTAGWNDAMDKVQEILGAVSTAPAACCECGHPKDQHGEGEDPVTPGQCRQCAAEGEEDESWHDYQPKEA